MVNGASAINQKSDGLRVVIRDERDELVPSVNDMAGQLVHRGQIPPGRDVIVKECRTPKECGGVSPR